MTNGSLLTHIRRLADSIFSMRTPLPLGGEAQILLELAVLPNRVQAYCRNELPNERAALLVDVSRLVGAAHQFAADVPDAVSYLTATERFLQQSRAQPHPTNRPWKEEVLTEQTLEIPGMIEIETMQYYQWLGRQHRGHGHAVELGCWMGSSTACLVSGLRLRSGHAEHKLHVYDSFVWQHWMSQYCENTDLLRQARPGRRFLADFRRWTREFADRVEVHDVVLTADSQCELIWQNGPVELLIVDLSDDYWQIETVWKAFEPELIDGESIVVLNQYGNGRAESIRTFVLNHGASLEPVHKPSTSAKGFTFRRNRQRRRTARRSS